MRELIGKPLGDIFVSDVSEITELNLGSGNVRNLTGIEYFTSLQTLDCSGPLLTSLDVSKNTALTTLKCSYNRITVLDLSKNTALTWLDCNTTNSPLWMCPKIQH